VGTSLLLVVFSATQWRAPRLLTPLLKMGQRSYEIYLTHEFVVVALFALFVRIGKPTRGVVPLFLLAIVFATALGQIVAGFFSEPVNRWLRQRWGEGPRKLGSLVERP